jgi:hypothetical protein
MMPGATGGCDDTGKCSDTRYDDEDDDCKKSYEALMQEFRWILDFEALNVPRDGLQAAYIRNAKIEYNRHARLHNRKCPNWQVPLFAVSDPLR